MRISLLLFFLLVPLCLTVGSVSLPIAEVWTAITGNTDAASTAHFVVLESRLPQLVTAVLSGMGLALSGLVMQTLFSNPLADPSLLGVNSGASLGAAIALLGLGGSLGMGMVSLGGTLLTVGAAFAGACAVIVLLSVASSVLRGTLSLLVTGVMLSFAVSAIIALLSFYATADGVRSFMVWGLGDFSGPTRSLLPLYAALIGVPMVLLLLMYRSLNALLLGNDYATNLGINVRCTRTWLLLITGALTASVTAVCGPISFIGLAVPHMARLLLRTADHRRLLPATALIGADVAMFALVLSHIPGERGTIPLAAITPLLGVPVVLYILLKGDN